MTTFFSLLWHFVLLAGGGMDNPQPMLYEGKTLSDWITAAKDTDPQNSKKATRVIIDVVVPSLIEKTTDKEYWSRFNAVSNLGRIGPSAKAAIPSLTIVLQDKEPLVRITAASALKKIDPRNKSGLPILVASLQVKDETVRCWATVAFADFGEEAVPAIFQIVPTLDAHGRMWATNSLASIGKPAFPLLVKAFEDQNPLVRSVSTSALGDLAISMKFSEQEINLVVPILRRMLNDTDPAVRQDAAATLRRLNDN